MLVRGNPWADRSGTVISLGSQTVPRIVPGTALSAAFGGAWSPVSVDNYVFQLTLAKVKWGTGNDKFLSGAAPRPVEPGTETLVPRLRHALGLRLISIREQDGVFGFLDHLEQAADWEDILVVDIEPGDGTAPPRAWVTWNSVIPGALREWKPEGSGLADLDPRPGHWHGRIALPETARPILGPDAAVVLTVTGRT